MRSYVVMGAIVVLTGFGAFQVSASPLQKATPKTQKVAAMSRSMSKSRLAPLPNSRAAASAHAPYTMGDCAVCHQPGTRSHVGSVSRSHSALCLDCHDQVNEMASHTKMTNTCTSCHNPHNAAEKMLLLTAFPRTGRK
jgi:predicted CXXCH cytochrome family protein